MRKAINPFPTIVRIQRNQPRTQNHVSIELRAVAFFVREKGEFSTLLKKKIVQILQLRFDRTFWLHVCAKPIRLINVVMLSYV